MLSSSLVHLDVGRGRATTRSGRRYVLGRRITPSALPDTEAWIAFALLAGPLAGIDFDAVLSGLDEALARRWLTACKAARHLSLKPPSMDEEATARFLGRHGGRYAATLRSRRNS